MNTLRLPFIVLMSLILTGCTFGYDEESFMDQTPTDTCYYSFENNMNNTQSKRNGYMQCELIFTSHLIIDGGQTPNVSPLLKVTIKKAEVKLMVDEQANTPNMSVCANIYDPQTSMAWNAIPEGIQTTPQSLFENALQIEYQQYFNVTVTLYYVVRIYDEKLANGYSESYEVTTRKTSSAFTRTQSLCVDIPIHLTSVKFDATVDNYN